MPYELDHIETLIAREIDNSLTPEEKAVLETWLNEDAEHRRYYNALKSTWALTGKASTDFVPDTERNWEQFRAHISPAPKKGILYTYRRALRIAATVILLAGAATLYFLFFYQPAVPMSIMTQAKEKKSFTLPDGTKVYLNQQSVLEYNSAYNQEERAVYLRGEAFFEVTQESKQPFIVYAGATKTLVLGTSFNVNAYKQDQVEVSVVSGKVAFSARKGGQQRLVLTTGNKGVLGAKEELKMLPIADPNVIAWKENRLSFHDTPLTTVIQTLERYFNVRITLADNSIADYVYNGTYDNPDLEKMLDVMCETMNLRYTKDGDHYILMKN